MFTSLLRQKLTTLFAATIVELNPCDHLRTGKEYCAHHGVYSPARMFSKLATTAALPRFCTTNAKDGIAIGGLQRSGFSAWTAVLAPGDDL